MSNLAWLKPRPHHYIPPGNRCANCETPLQGRWCYACGQKAEDFHRSAFHLIAEVFESFYHFDGRLWRTLPELALRPARLTRRFLDGHRASQIPPLRLFLISLLLVFVFGSSMGLMQPRIVTVTSDGHTKVLTGAQANQLLDAGLNEAAAQMRGQAPPGFVRGFTTVSGWFEQLMRKISANQERFSDVLERWSERFAFLLLPMSTLLLSLLFWRHREFYLFDHAIFSLHSLAAMGFLLTLVIVGRHMLGGWVLLLLFAAPVHLFVHMRGVYGGGVTITLLRMAFLGIASAIGFEMLMLGLLAVGLYAIR